MRNALGACRRAHVMRMGMRSRVQPRACVGARARARARQPQRHALRQVRLNPRRSGSTARRRGSRAAVQRDYGSRVSELRSPPAGSCSRHRSHRRSAPPLDPMRAACNDLREFDVRGRGSAKTGRGARLAGRGGAPHARRPLRSRPVTFWSRSLEESARRRVCSNPHRCWRKCWRMAGGRSQPRPEEKQKPAFAGLLCRADARTRTGDPFITSTCRGLTSLIRRGHEGGLPPCSCGCFATSALVGRFDVRAA